MEEITIRFEIVRLSIKLIDHESVNVQIDKLRSLSLDEHLNEIINLLETKNFRQALYMMKGYVASLDDSFFKEVPDIPTKKKKPKVQHKETQNLFDITQPRVDKTINLDDMLRMTEESIEDTIGYKEQKLSSLEETAKKETVMPNSSYKDKTEDEKKSISQKPIVNEIEVDNIKIEEPKETEKEDIEVSLELEVEVDNNKNILEFELESDDSDPLFNLSKDTSTQELKADEAKENIYDGIYEQENISSYKAPEPIESFTMESTKEFAVEPMEEHDDEIANALKPAVEDTDEFSMLDDKRAKEDIDEESQIGIDNQINEDTNINSENEISQEDESLELTADDIKYARIAKRYPPISYIDQKFKNMRHQFPQLEESEYGISDKISRFMRQIAGNGYSEQDIVDAISYFQECKEAGNGAEAAQMLLVAAASESKYAQLMLARELFKGEVLETNYAEAFTHINRLAELDYPEAICDLGQLYEYGYGIKKDKKTALLLYEEAAELGVARALVHFNRLSAKKGLFSSIFS